MILPPGEDGWGDDEVLAHPSSRFHLPEFTISVFRKPPVWRNGRRTGLKILGP
jgi:hypothetical protein